MTNEETWNTCAADPRPRWKQWLQPLFPHRRLPTPEWPYGVTTYVEMVFDWRDRLRFLVTGRVAVQVRVDLTNDPGRVKASSSVASVVAPWEPKPPRP